MSFSEPASAGVPSYLSPQLTDDVKKEKEKEPEKLDKMENSAVPKKKGFEEEHKDSDDDSSDDEQVSPRPLSGKQGHKRNFQSHQIIACKLKRSQERNVCTLGELPKYR